MPPRVSPDAGTFINDYPLEPQRSRNCCDGHERQKATLQVEVHGTLIVHAERKGQRREPAADDVRFVSEPIGWLPFAGPSARPFRMVGLSML